MDPISEESSSAIPTKYSPRRLWPGQQVSLRLLLLLAFVGQILGIVGLIGYLSWRNGQRTANNLGGQIRQELTYRIEQELRRYFETPHEINRLNVAAFARGELDVVEGTFGEAQLYQQMKISPNLAFVYCGSANSGEFFGVLRSPDDGSLQLSYGNQGNNFLRDYYSLDISGRRTFKLRQADATFDARQRPWYYEAVTAQGPAWTDVYIAFSTGLPNITASLPVYDRQGRRLLGVCATDVVLPQEFRGFLQDLTIGANGQAFVIDRQGQLISNSTDEPLMVGQGDTAQSVMATDSQDPLVRSAAQYLVDRFEGFDRIDGNQQLQFTLGGQRQFLEVVSFQDGFGLDWLIVVVAPESDFLGQVNANTRTTAVLSIAAVSAAILLAILASRWITQPIMGVAQASEYMAEGDLLQKVKPTAIAEMNAMATSFNTMTSRLHTSFSALSQSEAQNRALIAAIPDLLIRAQGDGTYIDILGRDRLSIYSSASFIAGTNVKASLPTEAAEQRLTAIQTALGTRELQLYEQQLTIDGQTSYEEVRVVALDDDQVLIMVRDITTRKRAEVALRIAEENYRSIYENALEGIFQSGVEGKFLSVNPAMAEIHGYSAPQEMMASIQNIRTQVYVDPEDEKVFAAQLQDNGEVVGFEYRIYRQDGSIIWVRENSRAVVDDTGTLLYYEGILQDITERKRIEAELRRQLEELQIEIDHQKREQDVASITQSGYFQEIQAEIAEIDIEEFWQ
jgi:PAS domain S-box-containing protein